MLKKLKKLFLIITKNSTNDCWAEITTSEPHCIYYFGPFESFTEAELACPGYIEDLENEGTLGIKVVIKSCNPDVLTIYDEDIINDINKSRENIYTTN